MLLFLSLCPMTFYRFNELFYYTINNYSFILFDNCIMLPFSKFSPFFQPSLFECCFLEGFLVIRLWCLGAYFEILHNQIYNIMLVQKITTRLTLTKTIYLIQPFSHSDQKRKFFKISDNPEPLVPIVYPKQYPTHPLTDTAPIIPRSRPVRHMTPRHDIPDEKMMEEEDLCSQKYKGKWRSPQNSYALNVGLIGPVNAGKSQLFGCLAHRISAVSPKASTTTEIISGVKSFERDSEEGIKNIQIKYFDTPGLMYKKEGFISKGWKVLSQIDFSLLVLDSAKRFDDMTKQSIKRLEKHRQYPNFMKALVLNKIDLVDNRRKFDHLIRQVQKYGKFDKIFHVSAKTGYGIPQLQQYLMTMSKKRDWQHPPQVKSSMTQTQIYEQFLREALFLRSYKELPHEIDIKCTSFSQLSDGKHHLLFDIFVETENHQRMIIGKQGRNMSEIKQRFLVSYARMYGKEAQLEVTVKIRNDWKNKHRGGEITYVKDFKNQDQQIQKILNDTLKARRISGMQRNLTTGQKINIKMPTNFGRR